MQFQAFPRLYPLVESFCRGEKVKKASILTKDQIKNFLSKAGNENRYFCVRKVVLCCGYLGGNRTSELRQMQFKSVERSHRGYEVTFTPSKQRLQVKEAR